MRQLKEFKFHIDLSNYRSLHDNKQLEKLKPYSHFLKVKQAKKIKRPDL